MVVPSFSVDIGITNPSYSLHELLVQISNAIVVAFCDSSIILHVR
jgi:hypothetical protein